LRAIHPPWSRRGHGLEASPPASSTPARPRPTVARQPLALRPLAHSVQLELLSFCHHSDFSYRLLSVCSQRRPPSFNHSSPALQACPAGLVGPHLRRLKGINRLRPKPALSSATESPPMQGLGGADGFRRIGPAAPGPWARTAQASCGSGRPSPSPKHKHAATARRGGRDSQSRAQSRQQRPRSEGNELPEARTESFTQGHLQSNSRGSSGRSARGEPTRGPASAHRGRARHGPVGPPWRAPGVLTQTTLLSDS
jgi:hypothetical protein